MAEAPGGRRRALPTAARRRVGPLDVLAIIIPLLTIAALALVRPVSDEVLARPPETVPLASSTLVCPAALPGAGTVSVAHAGGESGQVATVLPAGDTLDVDGTARTGTRSPVVLQADSGLAAGLVAGRSGAGAATACASPAPQQWFTGVGAGPEHASTLELVNPDRGPAVADVTVHGPDGVIDVPGLRGVTVPGGRVLSFDLAAEVPTRAELTLHVVVSRGRLGAHVVDAVDELGRGTSSRDWLPAQPEPASTSYLLGLGGKPGDRTLVVANPGSDEVRVELSVVTRESAFRPQGVDDVLVAPGATTSVDLTRLLRGKATRGATGLRLSATGPVTATLRSVANGDLSHAVAGVPVASRAALVLPRGPARLVLGAASSVGVATLTLRDDRGEVVSRQRVDVVPGGATRIKLAAAAATLDLTLERTTVVAAVEVGPPGLSVVPLSELVVNGRVPDVVPALR